MEHIKAPRGTQDILPGQSAKFAYVEGVMRQVSQLYGFQEIRTPMFEHTPLFQRSAGESSDVVNKEMYTFPDRSDRSLTLRPEGTAGVMRAIIENKMYAQAELPLKLFYYGPNFRYERPQAGRYRQFSQFGVESVGVLSPLIDAETIILGVTTLYMLGLQDTTVKLNSLGDDTSRASYQTALKAHFAPHLSTLCADCQRRYEQNPLRILDCKVDKDHAALASAPIIRDYLSSEAKAYFEKVTKILSDYNIHFEVDNRLVRGLDYYTHTIFEIVANGGAEGANLGTICAGGRYDHLIEQLGGPALPGVGYAFGIDRVVLSMDYFHLFEGMTQPTDAYVMPIGANTSDYAFEVMMFLRSNGIRCDMDYQNRSIKSQFKSVEKKNAKVALLIGEDELLAKTVTIKNNETHEQVTVHASELLHSLDSILGVNHSHDHDHTHSHDHDHDHEEFEADSSEDGVFAGADHDEESCGCGGHCGNHDDSHECGCGGACDGSCQHTTDEGCCCDHDHEESCCSGECQCEDGTCECEGNECKCHCEDSTCVCEDEECKCQCEDGKCECEDEECKCHCEDGTCECESEECKCHCEDGKCECEDGTCKCEDGTCKCEDETK